MQEKMANVTNTYDTKEWELISQIILSFHNQATKKRLSEFRESSFDLLHRHIPFDSAIWIDGVVGQKIRVHSLYPYKLSEDTSHNYLDGNACNTLIEAAQQGLGNTLAENLLNEKGFSCCCTIHEDESPIHDMIVFGYKQALSSLSGLVFLLRKRGGNTFSGQERLLAKILLPHMVQSVTNNHLAYINQYAVSLDRKRSSCAICDKYAVLHYVGEGFDELIKTRWPNWIGPILPIGTILQSGPGRKSLEAGNIILHFEPIEDKYIVTAHEEMRCFSLTKKEREVVMYLIRGLPYKSIASVMNISPSTVTNHVNNIYRKSGVHSKSELAAFYKNR